MSLKFHISIYANAKHMDKKNMPKVGQKFTKILRCEEIRTLQTGSKQGRRETNDNYVVFYLYTPMIVMQFR